MFRPLKWLGPDGKSYDPELLHLMQTAFDEAWAMQSLEQDPLREQDREVLAQGILEVVDHGERELASIKSYALGQLLRFRNQPQP